MHEGDKKIFITGGAGFFGRLLKHELLSLGYHCVSIDIQRDDDQHANLESIRGDISDPKCLEEIFERHNFSAIFHVAALLAHDKISKGNLWKANVEGTRLIAEWAKKYGVRKVIYTSSNCLYAEAVQRPVTESDPPHPAEIYGLSKWEGEKILFSYQEYFDTVIFRCPTIIAAGRLGLLAILFEFISENRKIWIVGNGDNRYQYIYAPDLIKACILAMDFKQSMVFNIGSDNVKTIREVYNYIIEKAHSRARLVSLPKFPTIQLMKFCHAIGISPLGPYHYKMIAENFIFDTSRIKEHLHWQPTKTNEEMLFEAYEYYTHAKKEGFDSAVSAHRQPAAMGIIKLLKWLS